MNSDRNSLQIGTSISLFSTTYTDEGSQFEVIGISGEGGSSICYDVKRLSDGKCGKLKEYYPAEIGYVDRDDSNYLVLNVDKKYINHHHSYIEAYSKLSDINIDGTINNFIPDWDLLCDGGDPAVTYVWMPNPTKGIRFDKYVEKKHSESGFDLCNALEMLECIVALCKCTQVLHSSGLLHLDIKPSNFLLQSISINKEEYNPTSLSLFDVNSIHLMSEGIESISTYGTMGFAAPELMRNPYDVGVETDIYSIGATMFCALTGKMYGVGAKSTIVQGYNDIADIVHQLSTGSIPRYMCGEIFDLMETVLKKCLNKAPQLRYHSCDALQDDLKSIIKMINDLIFSTEHIPNLLQGRYKLNDIIGKSHFGIISAIHIKANDIYNNREYIVTKLSGNANCDENLLNRYIDDKFGIINSLDHKHIQSPTDIIIMDNVAYIIFSCINGSCLRDFIEKKKPDFSEKLKLCKDICSIYSYLQSLDKPILPLIINPDDLYVDDSRGVLLFDFERWKTVDEYENGTRTGINHLPLRLSPPESFGQNPKYTCASTVYSLGLIMYGIFYGSFLDVILGDLLLVSKLEFPHDKISKRNAHKLRKIIKKCIEVDPINRYQSVLELVKELEKIGANTDKC